MLRVLPLAHEPWVFCEDCEENDNVETGGDCGGNGMAAGSTFGVTRKWESLSGSRVLGGERDWKRVIVVLGEIRETYR